MSKKAKTKTTTVVDGTPFGAWQVLKDGKWHDVDEIRRRCGSYGDGRVRELRYEVNGGFNVRTSKIDGKTCYMIPPSEIIAKQKEAACLNQRVRPATVDPVDRVHTIRLPVVDIVFLLAVIENLPQLNNQRVRNMWDTRRAIIVGQLQAALPAEIQEPYDLFEKDADLT